MAAGRADDALRDFDRALAAEPGFVEARRYRAVLLARRGDWASAGRDVIHRSGSDAGERRDVIQQGDEAAAHS